MNIKHWALPLSLSIALIVGCSKEPEPVDTNTKEMSIRTVNVDTVALRPMTGR